jgi:murein tripeptide amidase MpaA
MRIATVLALGLFISPVLFAQEDPALVRIDLKPDSRVLEALLTAEMDIAYVGQQPGEGIHVVADARDIEILDRSRVPYTVLHANLPAFYQSRFEPLTSRDLGYGSMGGFFTFAEVEDKLDEFRGDYPNLITQKQSIGQSHQGRDLWAVKISDNPDVDENEPEAIIDCLTHAREPQGMMSTLYFMLWVMENYPADPMARLLVEQREMWFVPVQNPDGYRYNQMKNPYGGGMWRKNRRNNGGGYYGVDLNRNWGYMWGYDDKGSSPKPKGDLYRGPYAMSEPETQAMAAFIQARAPKERMSIHTYSNLWLMPWSYDEFLTPDDKLLRALAKEMAPPAYGVGTCWEVLYCANGTSMDWDYGDQNIVTFSPEMGSAGDGFWPATSRIVPIAEENLPSLQYYFAVAGAFIRLNEFALNDISGKVNSYPDAGDRIELTVNVQNRGLEDYPSPVDLRITSASPEITIVDDTCQVGALASRAVTDNAADPFVFDIAPTAVYADELALTLHTTFHGITFEEEIRFLVGTARRTVSDEMETGTPQWRAGLPGDTAKDGFWECADPHGTWKGGDPVQPEDDHSPSGTKCFVTGAGTAGAGPDDHDVDNGYTRLLTPVFDLSQALHPRIGYSHWWYKEEDSEKSDKLLILITNNGGITWQEVQRVNAREMGRWTEETFMVEDFIALTDQMQMRFTAMDVPDNSTVEAAIDDFWIESYSTHPEISLFGGLIKGETCTLGLSWEVGAAYWIYLSTGSGPGMTLPGGTWYLDPPFFFLLYSGTIPADGRVSHFLPVPNLAGLEGTPFYFQSFVIPQGGGDPVISNLIEDTVQ